MKDGYEIIVTSKKITNDELKALCERWFGDMIKVVVDIDKKWVGIGGELHADVESVLLEKESRQEDLWGTNLYPCHEPEHRIDYTALINIRLH